MPAFGCAELNRLKEVYSVLKKTGLADAADLALRPTVDELDSAGMRVLMALQDACTPGGIVYWPGETLAQKSGLVNPQSRSLDAAASG